MPRLDGGEAGSGASPGQAEFILRRAQLGEEGPQIRQTLSFPPLTPYLVPAQIARLR